MIQSYSVYILLMICSFHWVKSWKKQKGRLWGQETSILNFFSPHWELSCCNKWPGVPTVASISPEISVKIHFHAWHGSKNTQLIYQLMEKSRLVLPSLASLLPGGAILPENTYSCILKVTGLRKLKTIIISIGLNHHQRWSH